MEVEKYIASGILELYVAGTLSEEENMEVYRNAEDYPKIKVEILAIEASILELTHTLSPKNANKKDFKDLKVRISAKKDSKVVHLPKNKTYWGAYTGWAAAILCAMGLLWFYNESAQLKLDLQIAEEHYTVLEQQIIEARGSLAKSQKILNNIRDKNITIVPLGGQEISPTSYAKAYWNKSEKRVFIDAKGLPEPPDGYVYQVWSLKLNPLTPTSLGLLSDFASDENKVFSLDNPNETEAFGITLEPAGGSATPTLEQLYTLGVATAP